MALLNGTSGSKPASSNDDLIGGDDQDNETMGGEGAQDTGAADDDSQDEGTVLCTILLKPEGGFTLVNGDEPDELDDMVVPEGASPAEGGTPALPKGKDYENTREGQGQCLKAILDLMRGADGEGDDGAQASFEEGFSQKPQE
jgi:hypothetical protein